MMTNPWFVTIATIVLIVLSAFFVIIEFALLSARRHRLEELAPKSRAARAALRASNELTIMLAGAQLGITVCTFALGAITKPAFDALLYPLFSSWMPEWGADVMAFALALFIVTFLHLVIGEMAPKSWAIAHPERAAMIIGIPARAFMWAFRPFLVWLNNMANRLVAASGVEPVNRAAAGGYDSATLQHLIEHSAKIGVLDPIHHTTLSGALDLGGTTAIDLVRQHSKPTMVPRDATVADVQEAALKTDHLRILVGDDAGGVASVVHVRDTLLADHAHPARDYGREPFVVQGDTTLHEALAQLRVASQQLAVVAEGDQFRGVITLSDVLRNVIPRSEGA